MKLFALRLAGGFAVGYASYVLSTMYPNAAWYCGWMGACTYYIFIAKR